MSVLKSANESSKSVEHSDRQFNDLPTKFGKDLNISGLEEPEQEKSVGDLFELIRHSEIGHDQTFSGPFGLRNVTYCDYTATGRSLSFIEDFIRDEVLTEYGSGCTGAIHALISGLDMKEPPICFVSPYEHHSNLLPWREIFSEMVYINENSEGTIDLLDLESKLKAYSTSPEHSHRLKIGCFTAASNITGSLTDTNSITILLHRHGALSFWDYATAAPHVHINMNPFVEGEYELAYKDAIYFSGHKFIGGPQTPGILVAKKKIFKNRVPYLGGGGGSVFYVTEKDHRYLMNDEMREESGTPAIVESIRAGLVFQLKNAIGTDTIIKAERLITAKAVQFLGQIPNLKLLGNLAIERTSIFSFLIKHEQTGLYLHSNFVSSILNDLFGIQSRSGCMCAGPYAQYLLGIDYELAKAYEEILVQDNRLDRDHLRIKHDTSKAEILRPGFTRLNIPFFVEDSKVDFILAAIKFVCENGWQFLPFYIFNLETGEWRHRNHQVFKDRKWLNNINYKDGKFNFLKKSPAVSALSDEECLKAAFDAVESCRSTLLQMPDHRIVFSAETSQFRWFLLPSEAYGITHSVKSLYNNERYTGVFKTRQYQLASESANELSSSQSFEIEKDKSFSEHAQQFTTDYDQSANQFSRLVRKELKQEDSTPLTCPIYTRKPPVLATKPPESSAVKSPVFSLNDQPSSPERPAKNLGHQWHHPPKSVFKPFIHAVDDFGMIKDGDRLLVCLSGGKDSLSLLHAVRQYQYVCRSKNVRFEFGAVTVDPKTPAYNPSALKPYLAELGVPYFYEEQCIIDSAASVDPASICSFCSRMKRGRIYATARANGYNVLALGQHLDDFTESFMMSLFFNGKLWCMKAHYKNEEQDLRVIRPFVYVREKDLRLFAESNSLPVISENCPACFEAPKERQRVKQLLAQQELNFPSLFGSLLTAIRPIFSIDKCQVSVKSLTELGLRLLAENTDLYNEMRKASKENESDLIEDGL